MMGMAILQSPIPDDLLKYDEREQRKRVWQLAQGC